MAGSGINGRVRSGRRVPGYIYGAIYLGLYMFEGLHGRLRVRAIYMGEGYIYGQVRLEVVWLRSAQPGSTVERREERLWRALQASERRKRAYWVRPSNIFSPEFLELGNQSANIFCNFTELLLEFETVARRSRQGS